MTEDDHGERRRLGAVVLAVLISQVLLYPGVPNLVVALGAPAGIDAGMWFLVAEFGAFVTFAVVWGAASDALGRRAPLIVAGALGGAASYIALAAVPEFEFGFRAALAVRVVGGALTIGAFSLAITSLMDLRGGNGRNMGTAGVAIGLGAAVGSVVGGALADLNAFYPVYAGAAVLAGAGLLAATVDDKVVTDWPADASGAQNDVGFRDVLAQARTTHGLFVPLAFGFVDRLTAGFFALVGVYYFQDPETFGLSAGRRERRSRSSSSPSRCCRPRSARFRTEWGASSPSCSGRSRTGSSLSASVWRRSTPSPPHSWCLSVSAAR